MIDVANFDAFKGTVMQIEKALIKPANISTSDERCFNDFFAKI